MKKKILVPIMALAIVSSSLGFSKTKDVLVNDLSLKSLLSMNFASAEATPQAGKFKKHKTATVKVWAEVDINGNILKIVEVTLTEDWDCCAAGGNGCSSDLPDC